LIEIETGNDGHFIDPYNLPGSWNQSSYSIYHSQSTRVRSIGDGGATGGLDDRFDFILNSQAVTSEGRIKYIPNSLRPFGNDGNHYNDSINKRPNTSVPDSIADALYYGSDHLPVMASYKFDPYPNAVNNITSLPNQFKLYQNYPNPFNPKTIINYELGITNYISLKVYNVSGRLVKTLVDQRQSAGKYKVYFNSTDLPSGTYFYRLSVNGISEQYEDTKQMILLK
jgi:hypothetical protein